jgi:hypothetical protein
MKREVNKRKVVTPDDLLACTLDEAGSIKKPDHQFRSTTLDFPTQLAKCFVVDVGFFRHLLLTVMNLSFQCDEFVIRGLEF